jgi:hypothetical protein
LRNKLSRMSGVCEVRFSTRHSHAMKPAMRKRETARRVGMYGVAHWKGCRYQLSVKRGGEGEGDLRLEEPIDHRRGQR